MMRLFRPKWSVIRPNTDHGPDYKDYDQTFQTEVTSDQIEPDHVPDYKDYDQTFQAEVTSDQIEPRPWSRL